MPSRLGRLAVIATAAGAFSGLFGVGGGTIIVPLLILWFGYGYREATGTSLAAIAVIGALGAALHGLYGNVDPVAGLLIGGPAVVGVVAGTALQQRLPVRLVAAGFAALLVASAIVLIIQVDLLGVLAIGLAAGVASGLLGVGGGVLFVPGLVIFLGESQLEAEATSLLAVTIVAAVGAARQRGYGNLRLRDALLVGGLSPLGVAAGTVLANELPERALELSFAGVQLYFAYRLARRALRPAESGVAEG